MTNNYPPISDDLSTYESPPDTLVDYTGAEEFRKPLESGEIRVTVEIGEQVFGLKSTHSDPSFWGEVVSQTVKINHPSRWVVD